MAKDQLGFLSEHFGTLVVGLILALFGAFISLAGVALLTWSQTAMNTIAIANNNVATAKAGESRFTKQDAERHEAINADKHQALRGEVIELMKKVSYIEGQHAGH